MDTIDVSEAHWTELEEDQSSPCDALQERNKIPNSPAMKAWYAKGLEWSRHNAFKEMNRPWEIAMEISMQHQVSHAG